jgi:hypothetical protein
MKAVYRGVSIAAFALCASPWCAAADEPPPAATAGGAAPDNNEVEPDVVVEKDAPTEKKVEAPPGAAPDAPVAPGKVALLEKDGERRPVGSDHWTWYGWQIILSDAAALTMVSLAEATASGGGNDTGTADTLLALGISQYVSGGFAVHAAHGRWLNAGLSVGVRLLAPAIGLAIGLGAAQAAGGGFDSFGDIAYGFLGGIVVAHLVDATALSFVAPRPEPVTRAAAVQWVPVLHVAPERHGGTVATFGVGAAF